MVIIYNTGATEFGAGSIEELRRELESWHSYKGMKPRVTIFPDHIEVEVDDSRIGQAETKVKLAYDCCNRGDWKGAEEFLRGALGICPLYSDAYRLLAQLRMQEGRTDDAVRECTEAIKCDPMNMWALILMGNLILRKGDPEGAMRYYRRVTDLYPENALALNNVAGALLGMGRPADALPLFEKVLAKEPSYANAHYGRAAALKDLGRKLDAFEAAREGCVEAVDTPENPGTRRELEKLMVSLARQVAEGEDYMKDVEEICAAIEVEYGYPVVTEADPQMPLLGKLRYWKHHGLDHNVLLYNPGKPFTAHYMVHELMHLRMMSLDDEKGTGKMVCSDADSERRFENRFAQILRPLRGRLGEEGYRKFFTQLRTGLASRTMNSPLDLFVEDMIFDSYPRLRPLQLLSLLDQEMANMKADESAAGMKEIPKVITDASLVMNLVQSLQVKELYGIDMTPGHKPSKANMNLARSLFLEYNAYKDTYAPGDEYELMEYFVDNLRLQDLLLIRDDVPAADPVQDGKLDLGRLMERTDEEKEAEKAFQEANRDGEDPGRTMMMALLMVGALDYMEPLPEEEVKRIAYDAAMLGVGGISPDKKSGYSLPSVPGRDFGGYEMLAWYYVSWALTAPDKVKLLNLPFSSAYETALSIRRGRNK